MLTLHSDAVQQCKCRASNAEERQVLREQLIANVESGSDALKDGKYREVVEMLDQHYRQSYTAKGKQAPVDVSWYPRSPVALRRASNLRS